MAFTFSCPNCGTQTEIGEQYAGQRGPCKTCGATITIPSPPTQPGEPLRASPQKSSSTATVLVIVFAALAVLVVCGGLLTALLLPAIQAAREAARRTQCANNLRQIGLALHAYHDKYDSFPPAYTADENGKPLHSWRVLVLPFMEYEWLYDEIDLSEPWDSPENRSWADIMPDMYACPSGYGQATAETSYMVMVGPQTIFPGAKPVSLNDIDDGSSNTILVVEANDSAVNWMEPKDLDATQMQFVVNGGMGEISSVHPGGAQVILADGSMHFLPESMPPKDVKAMSTRAGGETPVQMW